MHASFARLVLCLLLLLPGIAHASPDEDVRALLRAQVAAWNQRDLEGFMAGYWKSDQLTFFSGGTVTHGWQATLERYRARYQGAGKEMGTLSFADLSVVELAETAAVARGRWHLTMRDGKPVEGLFTVILRKLPEGWRIVHDHSSM
jgi:beta-aspartyl-peptidase (threonine type)